MDPMYSFFKHTRSSRVSAPSFQRDERRSNWANYSTTDKVESSFRVAFAFKVSILWFWTLAPYHRDAGL